jgi:hypothetical protein
MNELTDNKKKEEDSRIFSTTENKNSITNAEADIQFWTCRNCGVCEREEQDMFCINCINIEEPEKTKGFMNPSECLEYMHEQYQEEDMKETIKNASKIEDGLLDVIDKLQKENEKLNETIENMYWENLQEKRDFEEELWEQKMGDDL